MPSLAPDAPANLWGGVHALVDRAGDEAGLRAHGLHLIAAAHRRQHGRGVPDDLRRAERMAAAMVMTAPPVLGAIRAACPGQLALMKGLEVACRYPDPALRPFRDVDLLASEPEAAHAALVAAGYEPIGPDIAYDARHHLRPLVAPGTPVVVEIHRRVEWPKWGSAPPTAELLEAAVPSATGVAGLAALAPEHHVLALAAHSWSGAPLRRIQDLVDVALLGRDADREATDELARRWGIERMWRFIDRCAERLLRGDVEALPWWAADVRAVRDRTVLENHVSRVVAPFWVLPRPRAVRASLAELGAALTPRDDEGWPAKLQRAASAVRSPSAPLRGRVDASAPPSGRG